MHKNPPVTGIEVTPVSSTVSGKGVKVTYFTYCRPFEIILAILTTKFNSVCLMGQSVHLIRSFKIKKSRLASFLPFSFQFSSVAQSYPILCDPMDCSTLSITNSQSLLKLMSTELVMPSNHLLLCCPLLLLPSIFPSIRVSSNESVLHIRWPKFWSFSFSISPFNEYLGLISFRMDWLDLLAVQGTLKCLLQHHSSKASILQPSAFFIVQLSHPYMPTGKAIALTRRTFVGEVMHGT